MAVISIFNGNVAANGSNVSAPVQLPARKDGVAVSVSSAYSATAATTGVKLQVASSIDDGLTYSDYSDAVSTAPTVSSVTAVQSQKTGNVVIPGATHLQYKLVNLDATNVAQVTLVQRAYTND